MGSKEDGSNQSSSVQEEEEEEERRSNADMKNPYFSGCLHNKLSSKSSKLYGKQPRVCNSDDPDWALVQGLCRPPAFPESYLEIRSKAGNWYSSIFHAWIVQMKTELLAHSVQSNQCIDVTHDTCHHA